MRCKKIAALSLAVIMGVSSMLYSKDSFAAERYRLFRAHFKKGKLKYSFLPNCNTYIASNAATKWNGISKYVKLSPTSESGKGDINIVCNVTEPMTDSKLGYTFIFSNGRMCDPTENHILSSATCVQYNNKKYFETDIQRISTTVHEIGHALSIAHPIESVDKKESVMKSGRNTIIKPTALDEVALCRAASLYWNNK